ncbi:MAG: hypothetical protein CL526_02235 [Aequorivita sp.]|nr:hypothetical protein [Aequorivita sp.]|tara:strand:+ start:18182 stop:18424 length:243 start_codon:yes stop_codon:yes gene_type:complete
MFKKVINTPGFWKSVFALTIASAVLFTIIKWALDGFDFAFLTDGDPLLFLVLVLIGSFCYGFLVTFGKFRSKLKENEPRE